VGGEWKRPKGRVRDPTRRAGDETCLMTPLVEIPLPAADPKAAAGRLAMIDGLRGVAALAVVVFHLYTGTLSGPLSRAFPAPLRLAFANGRVGVQIFFVISGFVIAYSLRRRQITPPFAARFVLRRQIRLDPAYWTLLVISLLNLWVPTLWHPGRPNDLPNLGQVAAHLFYVQGVAGAGYVVPIFWTLCIEVQFYLVFVLTLAAAQAAARLGRSSDGNASRMTYIAALAPTALASAMLLLRNGGNTETWPPSPWFVTHWYLFALGVLACWAVEGRVKGPWFWGYAAATYVLAAAARGGWVPRPEPAVGLITAALIYLSGRRGRLHDGLNNAFLQYFGMISYSLYLVHYDVGYRFLNAGYRLTGASVPAALAWFGLALAASVAAAHLLYVLVERPSLNLARRLGGTGRTDDRRTIPAQTATVTL
jgi:peptidoglycan/LPS O-acetylase OafA/YrhL